MTRFADSGSSTPESTIALVDGLIERKYPYLEEIEGRIYINIEGLSAGQVGLLILDARYPKRMKREELLTPV